LIDAERAQIISLGEDLPKLWDAASVVERKQILRLVVKEVVLVQIDKHSVPTTRGTVFILVRSWRSPLL